MGTDPGGHLKEHHLSQNSFLCTETSVPLVSVKMRLGGGNMMTSRLIAVSMGSLAFGQTNFGGVGSSSGSSSGSASSSQEFPLGSLDTDTRFFTGNEALNGGLVGAGLGALGATILGPAVGGALNNGNFNNGNSCGKRRKRQAENGETRFFLPSGGSCTCNNGRKRRQAGERKDGGDKRFFFGGGNNHCGSCCYNNYNNGQYNNGYNNGQYNNGQYNNGQYNNGQYNNGHYNNGNYNNGFSSGFTNGGGCQCNNGLSFRDQYGNTHGACQRTDNTGRTWCYTTGWGNSGCGDLQTSKRFPSNPWSYRACGYNG